MGAGTVNTDARASTGNKTSKTKRKVRRASSDATTTHHEAATIVVEG